jgi:hypothetical protein
MATDIARTDDAEPIRVRQPPLGQPQIDWVPNALPAPVAATFPPRADHGSWCCSEAHGESGHVCPSGWQPDILASDISGMLMAPSDVRDPPRRTQDQTQFDAPHRLHSRATSTTITRRSTVTRRTPHEMWSRASQGTATVDRFRSQLSISRLVNVEAKMTALSSSQTRDGQPPVGRPAVEAGSGSKTYVARARCSWVAFDLYSSEADFDKIKTVTRTPCHGRGRRRPAAGAKPSPTLHPSPCLTYRHSIDSHRNSIEDGPWES